MLIPALGAALAAAAMTAGAPAAADQTQCFNVTEWRGWSAPSPDVLLLRVRSDEVYRVELGAGSHQLRWADSFLVSKVNTGRICSAIDLDLKVSSGNGFTTPLIARSIARLTPEEIAALPAKDRP